jgi:hypothetical protein
VVVVVVVVERRSFTRQVGAPGATKNKFSLNLAPHKLSNCILGYISKI